MEIKFRAVLKETQEVFPVTAIWSNSVCLDTTNGDYEWNSWVKSNESIELIQYTGLIDIKGNQIYNADLIKDDENFIWEVFYSQGAFYAQCEDLMAKQLLSSINLFGSVVGNKYEHPNLIGA